MGKASDLGVEAVRRLVTRKVRITQGMDQMLRAVMAEEGLTTAAEACRHLMTLGLRYRSAAKASTHKTAA